MDVIHTNAHLWKSVGGPDAEALFRPSAANLELRKEVSERLEELKAKEDRDGVQEFCDELKKAVDSSRSNGTTSEWHALT